MTTLSIYETRRLVLPIETVVEAVMQFDRDSGGTLFQGTILDATIETEPSPRLVLAVRRRSTDAIEHRTFTLPAIAAAIINHCRQARIPLPRNGKKLLEVVPEGLAFCIQTTINMPRWHNNWAQPPRKTKSGATLNTRDSQAQVPDASDATDAA